LVFSHILITRPEPECTLLAESLRDLAAQAVCLPAMGFGPLDARLDAGGTWGGAKRRLAIFVSPRAAAYGLAQLPAGFLDGARVAAIGPATAEALASAGVEVDLVPRGGSTSEELLALPELAAPAGGAAVVFAAPGGREALPVGLGQLGWTVHLALVYERRFLDPDRGAIEALRAASAILSVWTSGVAMEHLLAVLPGPVARQLLAGCFVVASERLARQASELGAAALRVSAGADNDSLARCIRALAG